MIDICGGPPNGEDTTDYEGGIGYSDEEME